MKTKQFGTVIGTFSKATAGGVSVNFAPSGGTNCSAQCPLKGTVCYAETTEKMKPSITTNLVKKAADFSGYLKVLASPKALAKLAAAPWVRFSAFGSIKDPSQWTAEDRENLTTLANSVPNGRTHFPVETLGKAQALQQVGMPGVRYSAANNDALMRVAKMQHVPASMTFDCGTRARGKNKRTISQPAIEYAKTLQSEGINARVCPAIAGSAKCGQCTMCGDAAVDVVIYPLH